MPNTVDITEDRNHEKRDQAGYDSKRLPSRRVARRAWVLLPLLLICILALYGNGMSFVTPVSNSASERGEAQNSFDKLKTLEGSWEGHVTTTPRAAEIEGHPAHVTLRVTSRGNALMHEMRINGIPDDPITMFYVEDGRFLLTHYCDAGNRPRMEGKFSPDGNMLEFDFLDVAGGNQKGHMHHTMFTIIDSNHHTEDWTYMLPGNGSVRAHFDLQRAK
ncbi:MAG: hypothetical protein M3362_12530 [Acidobacteriota bacterium]|nr:hypothetical protein [Acidobacteriota bacterium]